MHVVQITTSDGGQLTDSVIAKNAYVDVEMVLTSITQLLNKRKS